jgi:hypothetical protein
VTAQLARLPLLDDEEVGSDLVIGPNAARPLELSLPLFVSDMSFGALSEEAKVALARGAELAGTGICSGEGGMPPEEQQVNSRYLYELASARFRSSWDKLDLVQAFHLKGGQAAKTGTGGHLPGHKVSARIAAWRRDAGRGLRIQPCQIRRSRPGVLHHGLALGAVSWRSGGWAGATPSGILPAGRGPGHHPVSGPDYGSV